jgi:enoyl-CoA hydratase
MFVSRSFRSSGIFLRSCAKNASSDASSVVTENLTELGVKVGAYAQVERVFSLQSVKDFALICGDNNPIHTDPEYASKSRFKHPIVHGILVSSQFSMLLGSIIHGGIYVSQTLTFKAPVLVGEPFIARVEILNTRSTRSGIFAIFSTKVLLSDGTLAVDGEGKLLIPHGTPGFA